MQSAGGLAFANDASVFWGGIERLVGGPNQSHLSLQAAMEAEHCGREDADEPFEARNYGTPLTAPASARYKASL